MLAFSSALQVIDHLDHRPAVSAPWRRCRGKPAACRRPRAPGSGTPPRIFSTSNISLQIFPVSPQPPPPSTAPHSGSMPQRRHDVADEALDLQPPRLGFAQAALPHVEDRLGIHLPHRRAVRAFHVVGIDLQLRLGRDTRRLGSAGCCGSAAAHRCAGRRAPHRPARRTPRRPYRPRHLLYKSCCGSRARCGSSAA